MTRLEFAEQLIDKALAMRSSQRRYFSSRSNDELAECKRLEKEIDNLAVQWRTGRWTEQENLL